MKRAYLRYFSAFLVASCLSPTGQPHEKWMTYWARVSVMSIFTHQFCIPLMGGAFKIFMRLP